MLLVEANYYFDVLWLNPKGCNYYSKVIICVSKTPKG